MKATMSIHVYTIHNIFIWIITKRPRKSGREKKNTITHTNEMYGILRKTEEKKNCCELPLLHLKKKEILIFGDDERQSQCKMSIESLIFIENTVCNEINMIHSHI